MRPAGADRLAAPPAPANMAQPRPLLAGTGALLLAAIVAALVLAVGATNATAPAWAITHNPDGTITLTIRQIRDLAAVNQKPARDGVRARIVPFRSGCRTVLRLPLRYLQPSTQPWSDAPRYVKLKGPVGAWTVGIIPDRIPRDGPSSSLSGSGMTGVGRWGTGSRRDLSRPVLPSEEAPSRSCPTERSALPGELGFVKLRRWLKPSCRTCSANSSVKPGEDPITEDQNRALILRFYEELWNAWRLDTADEILSPNISFRGTLGTTARGRDEFKTYVEAIRLAFPDWQNEINELLAIRDRVVARLTWSGTHTGPLGDIAPTGSRVTYVGAAFFRVTDAQIEEAWIVGDTQELWRALGLLAH